MLSAETKQQAAQIADRAIVVGVTGTGAAWSLQEWSHAAGIAAAAATFVYVVVKCLYLLRLWYLAEKRIEKTPPPDCPPIDD